ncbi:bud neck involved protein [Paecilomyces lecythidis]|uniref:Bud neck involved protein n=1 Tax=Paecilomyces lecythidis TaxID=3004212 RepID=A0ABR3XXU8_9EURO
MAAIVQTIPQTGTVTMLQTRPSSSSGSFASPSHSHQQSPRSQSVSHTMGSSTNLRGHQAMAPVAPYAFTATPGSAQNRQSWAPQPRLDSRSSSANSVPQGSDNTSFNGSMHNSTAGSVSTASTSSSGSYMSKDDTALPSRRQAGDLSPRPLSTVHIPSSSFMNIASPVIQPKPSPDRYRRGNRRAENSTGAHNSAGVLATSSPVGRASTPDSTTQASVSSSASVQRPFLAPDRSAGGHVRVSSADDTRSEKLQQPELAKRYRRRSWATIDTAGVAGLSGETPSPETSGTNLSTARSREERPSSRSSHSANGSTDSIHSMRSNHSAPRESSANRASPVTDENGHRTPEISKRPTNPSPLSNPVTMSPVADAPKSTLPAKEEKETRPAEGSAAQRLAEITKAEQKKAGKSRLRRAFSFGSASELRRVSAQQSLGRRDGEVEKSRRQQLSEELGAEQAEIAERQEASGLGESIYSHFAGSTDNLSISSTASSASIMLRKMGKGMKRSTRSLVGLFRPKSLVNTAADPIVVEPMAPKVSIVNIEADKKGLGFNPDTHGQPGSGLFPNSDGASTDTSRTGSLREASRKSIVGGEKERAEVLAAVRKGILKRTGTDSGTSSPASRPAEPSAARSNDSPHSSAPSTPEDQAGQRRADAVKIEGEDYFLSVSRLGGTDSKSAPITPSKNLVFSPRIQFHETWPSGEYDRRGDIATCNRLTPLLAQQIKEELNNFKMEMEVHETSKVYTHFL